MIAVGYSKRVSNFVVKDVVPIKEQNDRIRDYASAHGFEISKFYEDKSNDPGSDSGFQKMRVDGMNRRFDLVVLDSLFRCGKSFGYAKNLLYMTFYKLGIHFVVLEDGVNTMEMTSDEVDSYFLDMRSGLAEACELSDRQEKYKKEKQIPVNWERYGYMLNEDRTEIVLDEVAAENIRLIFEQAASGIHKTEIARYLNEIHAITPSVRKNQIAIKKNVKERTDWGADTVSRIMSHEFYMGDDQAAETEGVIYPRIIEPELYYKAQEIVKPKPIRRYTKHYLFKRCIYFEDTNDRVCYREYDSDGEMVGYYHVEQDDIPIVKYEEVYWAVQDALKKEREQAIKVCQVSYERKLGVMEAIDDSYRERAKELYRLSRDAQDGNVELYERYSKGELSQEEYESIHGEIMKKQEETNRIFHEMMRENLKKKVWLGKENPWVRRFLKYDPDKDLTCKTVNTLVRRIEVYGDGTVKVLLNTDEKEYIPEEFFGGEV